MEAQRIKERGRGKRCSAYSISGRKEKERQLPTRLPIQEKGKRNGIVVLFSWEQKKNPKKNGPSQNDLSGKKNVDS